MFLIFVFDGLRPELVHPELMPRLSALRDGGTWFERSHCVFPSVTRVNAASLASGSHPGAHGIPANTLYLPDRCPGDPLRTTGDVAVLGLLREAPDAALLNAPTLGEVLAESGHRMVAAGSGSPGSAYLLHPEARRTGGMLFHHTFTYPEALAVEVGDLLGPPPRTDGDYSVPATVKRVQYAARALTRVLVPEARPAVAAFWCTVPDSIHNRFGLGSPEAAAGLRAVDAVFGELLDDLERMSGEPPNAFVTSDHGYATVDRVVDVAAELAPLFSGWRKPPVVAVDGGAVHLYLGPHAERAAELAERLLAFDWISAVCSRLPVPGAVPLSTIMLDTPRGADLIACFDWRHGDNGRGVDGLSAGGGGIALGAGDHGGASSFEMRNTMLASGPAFARGTSDLPAGIVDVAPTVCRTLGVAPPARWDGRVLEESLYGTTREGAEFSEIEGEPTAHGIDSVAAVERAGSRKYLASLSKRDRTGTSLPFLSRRASRKSDGSSFGIR